MGPFMVEIVFCRVTRRGRKKGKGMNKLARENMRNDGPMQSFIPKDDMLKVTLDLSDNGPVFSALDDMMLKLSLDNADEAQKNKKGSGDAKKALKNLLKSGIPGIEGMFGGEQPQPRFGKKSGKKGFHKMNEGSKKKFMTAIFGEEGTQVDSSTAAALLAATCSGGNPEVGNKLAELLVPNMGETVDPAMMAGLMSACSLINAGSGTEEVMKAMCDELAASGMSEDEILEKAQLLMKAFGKEDTASTAEYKLLSKQRNTALHKAGISPKDFTAIMLAHKAIAACGTTPENVAKIFILQSTLAKKGANPEHIASAMRNLGQLSDELKEETRQRITDSWADGAVIKKADIGFPVRMHLALDNENEPQWTEVKNLKDIVDGVSANSPEAIELNLARATKSGGLKKDDVGRANIALKAVSSLGVDPIQLSRVLFMEKTICDNGVPPAEVGRVLLDGLMPAEATQGLVDDATVKLMEDLKSADVECTVKIYNNLKFKSNCPNEVVEYVDKTLIQVRCSLEDVADNMISTMRARGEKEMKITLDVTETLKKTGASAVVVSATIMPPLKELTGKREVELSRVIGSNLKAVDYSNDDVKGAMTEMIIKIIDSDPSQHQDACSSLEYIFKELGELPNAIKDFIASSLPPPPTPPEEVERRLRLAEEMERLEAEEIERERVKAYKLANPEPEEDDYVMDKPKNKKIASIVNGDGGSRRGSVDGSRRGSLIPPPPRSRQGSITIGGLERRGSYYDDGVTTRATVAMVTDDPEHKKNLKKSLSGVFNEQQLQQQQQHQQLIDSDGNLITVINPTLDNNGMPIEMGMLNHMGIPGQMGMQNQVGMQNQMGMQNQVGMQNQMSMQNQMGMQNQMSGLNQTGVSYQLGGPGSEATTNGGMVNGSGAHTNGHQIPGMDLILSSLPEDASPEDISAAFEAAGLSGADKDKLMQTFISSVSEESRALMQKILESSSSQDEISSRVAALLAGTALSTSRGERKESKYGDIAQVNYDIENANLSAAGRRKDNFEMPDIPNVAVNGIQRAGADDYRSAGVNMRDPSSLSGAPRTRRTSIKLKSEMMREARKSRQEEREEDKRRNESYYRRVAGLRRAKVPLMVYSCGGFSRCFRVARFYDAEGPPIGIVYEKSEDDESRAALNPDL